MLYLFYTLPPWYPFSLCMNCKFLKMQNRSLDSLSIWNNLSSYCLYLFDPTFLLEFLYSYPSYVLNFDIWSTLKVPGCIVLPFRCSIKSLFPWEYWICMYEFVFIMVIFLSFMILCFPVVVCIFYGVAEDDSMFLITSFEVFSFSCVKTALHIVFIFYKFLQVDCRF